ncbi:leukocyte tyrosine kinase receptor-like isoform X1 [Hyperolius riggenbachi]|uniref:leukocyte tyrosine kinase receptor-like isoform X1 n=1 Tax=Hyperolius riggenbachi TaxID=752182 RepID=UPI0035A3179B
MLVDGGLDEERRACGDQSQRSGGLRQLDHDAWDIVAQNCLLTHTSSGHVAKIGDFGMARDIGGERGYEIVFTKPLSEMFSGSVRDNSGVEEKTSLCTIHGPSRGFPLPRSFGVLLWVIFSLGYMPYTCKTRLPRTRNNDAVLAAHT